MSSNVEPATTAFFLYGSLHDIGSGLHETTQRYPKWLLKMSLQDSSKIHIRNLKTRKATGFGLIRKSKRNTVFQCYNFKCRFS